MPNRSALFLLLTANAISGVAQGISMIAVPWYFAQQGLMTEFGYIYVLSTVFSLFWSPYGGTLVDRFNRQHLFMALNAVGALVLLALGSWGVWRNGLPWPAVASAFLFTFLNYNLHFPSLYAFAQEITPRSRFGSITSILEIANQSTSVLAGAGAALLLEGTADGYLRLFGFAVDVGFTLEAWPIHRIFLLDGSTYCLAFTLVALMRYRSLVERKSETGNTWKRLRTGAQYLRRHPTIFWFGVSGHAVFLTVLIVNFYLGAAYVRQHLGESGDTYASYEMLYATGAIFAGILVRRIFRRVPIPVSIVIMMGTMGGLYLVLGLSQSLVLFFVFALTLGICNAGTRIQRTTWLFRHVPNQLYGRTGSLLFLVNTIMRIFLVSVFALPFFQRDGRVAWTFFILGCYVLVGVGVMASLWLRKKVQ